MAAEWRPLRRARRVAAGAGVVLLSAAPAYPQGTDFVTDLAIRLVAAHSDNLLRQSVAPLSGSYRGVGFVFDIQRNGPRLETDFSGDIEYRQYSGQNIDDDRFGSVNAFIGIDAVEDVFAWIFDDSYGQGRSNSFLPSGPNNRQDINSFRTGPRLTLPLGARTTLRFDGTRTQRRFSNTNQLDSDSDDLQLGVFRALSPVTEVGLSAASREITYDDNPLLSWDVDSVFISYQRQLASGSTSLQVGESTIEFGNFKSSNPLVNFGWARELGIRSTLNVSAAKGQADPGDSFARANAANSPNAIGGNNAFLGQGVYEFSDIGIANTIDYTRTSITISWGVGESDYLANQNFNNEQQRIAFSVRRNVTPRLDIGLNASVFERKFKQLNIQDDGSNGELWLAKQFARRVSLRFSYVNRSRDRGIGQYDENVTRLGVTLDLNP